MGRKKRGFWNAAKAALDGVEITIKFGGSGNGRENDDGWLIQPQELLGSGDEGDEDVTPSQCEADTKDGLRCTRNAEPDSDFCWQHRDKQ